jgi:tetratricopeptide (TPR) repeat protein
MVFSPLLWFACSALILKAHLPTFCLSHRISSGANQMKAVVRTLIVLTIFLAGCKPPAVESLKIAEEAEKGGLWTVALENYESLVKNHPDDALAEKALFNIAAIQHNSLQNFQAAVEGYKRYVAKYPDSAKAPTALFLIGFLYNNELKNLDSARVYYQQFLAKYPGNEMAMSAQFELQNLGKSADELLPKPEPMAETAPQKPAAKKAAKPVKKN